ncbi:hypothetical protein KAR29_04765 [Aminithiophilus ramosus]|uniref:Uncharacterized protein n=1 Tax=Aminithiophilus ramosus TaxID=3029084 RepID=A0A9Q7AA03_9BACT|nr:hypothetical protein [Aminithiophilus ramosus]QTX33210.1 hypothetical protein KAR29_04765 [Aminithiophilus ramosus]
MTEMKPRGMKRREVREFRKAGLDVRILPVEEVTGAKMVAIHDWIAERVYPDVDFDDWDESRVRDFCSDTLTLTFGTPESRKNLLTSGSGTAENA